VLADGPAGWPAATGLHEVIIETPNHDGDLRYATVADTLEVLRAARDRCRTMIEQEMLDDRRGRITLRLAGPRDERLAKWLRERIDARNRFFGYADLRPAVDEACTRLIRSAMPDSMLLLVVDPRDDAVVIDVSTACKSPDILSPGSFSWHVLSSLTDEVHTFQDGQGPAEGRTFGISMMTRRASSLR